MFWLNLLFEYISTFFLRFTAALVWGFSFSHSSLGPLKASLPAAPPHSPGWRCLRTHIYLPPLSVFPLEKKGLLNSAFQPYQSSFWNLPLWDDSWKKWHTDCERRFWQVTTLPPTHIWVVLKSFGGLHTNKATLCVGLDYQYHRKRIFPWVSLLLCWWRVLPESRAACVGWFWGLMKRRNYLSKKLA